MRLFRDFFVSSHDKALVYESTTPLDGNARLKRFYHAERRGITSLEVGTFWAILANKEWGPDRRKLIDVAFGEGDKSWLHHFQDKYVALFSRLAKNAVNIVAQAWCEVDELSCLADDVCPVVAAPVRLSQR